MKLIFWIKPRWVIIFCAAALATSGYAQSDSTIHATRESVSKYPVVEVKERGELSQYGITWKFARPVKSGQFVNGDWWVVGPVTVACVTPGPSEGPLEGEVDLKKAVEDDIKDITGFRRSVAGYLPRQLTEQSGDRRMRNGSMILVQFGSGQGYDSRSTTYDPACSVIFPCTLKPDRTLISTISRAFPIAETGCHKIMWRAEKSERSLLRTAAVLTCLASEPPADAFRPPYAGTEKPIYQTRDLRWDLLLTLPLKDFEGYFHRPWLNPADSSCEVATWADFEGYFQRPWLNHYSANGFDQVLGYMKPTENQLTSDSACFGRDDARLVSIASLMVHLDVPKERKEKLLIGLLQRGIDLSGQLKLVTDERCAWLQSGCKWPILFASLMLDRPELRQLPEQLPFHEDITTYYGTGWFGQTALWRIVFHGTLMDSGEEHSPEQRNGNDVVSEMYRSYGASGKAWLGTALAARLMKAIRIWGHDAFFDYCDRWIDDAPCYKDARGVHKQPEWETNTWDPFVEAMWRAYRKSAPEPEMSGKNLKAGWEYKPDGWHVRWVANPKPDQKEVAEHVAAIHKAYPQNYPEAAQLAKARQECEARTAVAEAEANCHPVPANTVVVVSSPKFVAQGNGQVTVSTTKCGAVGPAILKWDAVEQWLEWELTIPAAGYYNLTLCYCSNTGIGDQPARTITINGTAQEPFAPFNLPSTGGFANDKDDWRLQTAMNPLRGKPLLLKLTAGKNTIRLTNSNGISANLNYLAVTSPDVTPTRERLGKTLAP